MATRVAPGECPRFVPRIRVRRQQFKPSCKSARPLRDRQVDVRLAVDDQPTGIDLLNDEGRYFGRPIELVEGEREAAWFDSPGKVVTQTTVDFKGCAAQCHLEN